MTTRIKVTTGQNILRMQNLQEVITAQSCLAFINFRDDVLEVLLFIVFVSKNFYSRYIFQPGYIALVILTIYSNIITQTLQIC